MVSKAAEAGNLSVGRIPVRFDSFALAQRLLTVLERHGGDLCLLS